MAGGRWWALAAPAVPGLTIGLDSTVLVAWLAFCGFPDEQLPAAARARRHRIAAPELVPPVRVGAISS